MVLSERMSIIRAMTGLPWENVPDEVCQNYIKDDTCEYLLFNKEHFSHLRKLVRSPSPSWKAMILKKLCGDFLSCSSQL